MSFRPGVIFIASLFFSTAAALADPVAPTAACPTAEDLRKVAVTSVFRASSTPGEVDVLPKATETGGVPRVELRQAIGITVDNLDILLQQQDCPQPRKKIVLFLDGRPVQDLNPFPVTDPSTKTLKFQLQRTEASRDVWTFLLGKPEMARNIQVSVGFEDGYPVAAKTDGGLYIELVIMPARWLYSWFALVLVLFFGCMVLAKKSNMLRDSGPGENKPYSLARVQLAAWTFLVLASFLFIGLITGDYTTSITDPVLALMGISAGTAVGASMIDSSSAPAPAPAAAMATGGSVAMQGQLAPVAAPALPGDTAQSSQLVPSNQQGTAGQVVSATPTTIVLQTSSGKWWLDILTDQDGVSFHRFQMAAWTIVLGIIFIRQVYTQLAMPQFDATLLGLIGISSGTYLGMKRAERPPR